MCQKTNFPCRLSCNGSNVSSENIEVYQGINFFRLFFATDRRYFQTISTRKFVWMGGWEKKDQSEIKVASREHKKMDERPESGEAITRTAASSIEMVTASAVLWAFFTRLG